MISKSNIIYSEEFQEYNVNALKEGQLVTSLGFSVISYFCRTGIKNGGKFALVRNGVFSNQLALKI